MANRHRLNQDLVNWGTYARLRSRKCSTARFFHLAPGFLWGQRIGRS